MIFRQLFHQETGTYTYLPGCAKTGDCAVTDPVADVMQQYLTMLDQLHLKLAVAIDTHTHADHITAYGRTIKVGTIALKALYTPGHTDESFSFYTENKVFTGDVLLIRGSGRTDFQGGDAGKSRDSIHSKLFSLPDSTLVYPGHDYKGWTVSSIAEAKACNPRIAGKTRQQYIKIMNKLKLPNPEMMDIALPANLRCGRSS